jgi:L-lactate utilization protein LutB
MQSRGFDHRRSTPTWFEAPFAPEAVMAQQRQLSDQPPSTIAEIDAQIAADRLEYITAYFAGHERDAQYWVYEIARLENLRNIVQRQNNLVEQDLAS